MSKPSAADLVAAITFRGELQNACRSAHTMGHGGHVLACTESLMVLARLITHIRELEGEAARLRGTGKVKVRK